MTLPIGCYGYDSESYNIASKILRNVDLLRNCWTEMYQYVRINNWESTNDKLITGFPQGTNVENANLRFVFK